MSGSISISGDNTAHPESSLQKHDEKCFCKLCLFYRNWQMAAIQYLCNLPSVRKDVNIRIHNSAFQSVVNLALVQINSISETS